MPLDVKFVLDETVGGPPSMPLKPDANGRYRLPAVRLTPGEPGVRVERFTCWARGASDEEQTPPDRWQALVADAWRGADLTGARLDRTVDIHPEPVPAPGPGGTGDHGVARLVCEVEYLMVDRLTGREILGVPYRSEATVLVSFAAPADVPWQAAGVPRRATEVPLRPPEPPETDRYLGHAAIDFGTSNSTVTLYDALIHTSQPFAPSQVQRLRAGIVHCVLDGGYPKVVAGEWESVLALTAAEMDGDSRATGAGYPDEARALAARIGSETGSKDLFKFCLLLEQRLPDCSHTLRYELARRLYHCYDEAFAEPPLEPMRLFPVELGDGSIEVSSRIEVLQTHPLAVRLGEPERLIGPAAAGLPTATGTGSMPGIVGQAPLAAFRGLKLRLSSPRPMDELPAAPGLPAPTSDDLIRSALGYLVERSNRYIRANTRGTLGSGRIDDIVLTYPTVATPDVRRKLRSLVADGLGVNRVSMHFDEAIAAVMFFVMRDFGGDLNVGVEAFRARSRSRRRGNWVQNVLTIDIGGGTTDMALLTLSLKDTTPLDVLERPDAGHLGRHYTLTPTVRGSSGHTRLGGDLLTLTVFHWLKAEIADRLIALRPDSYRTELQGAKATYLDDAGEYIAGRLSVDIQADDPGLRAAARRLAEAAVPTQWKNAPPSERDQRRWTFEQLWKLADQAKIHLGGSEFTDASQPSPLRFAEQELSGLLASLGQGDGPEHRPAGTLSFELDAARFRTLVEPHLRNVVDLADGMLKQRLKRGEPLDRVVLTGKTSAMPLVREVLVSQLGRGWKLDWDPANIEVERAFAKTATSIGAAWAEHLRQTAFAPEGAIPVLEQGRTVVQIDVENLFFALPCAFERGIARGAGDLPLFSANEELHHLMHTSGERPVLSVRSAQLTQLTEVVSVVRVREGTQGNITWGQFKCPAVGEQLPGAPPGSVLDPAVWPHEISVRFEVTADLDVFGHLSYGPPHYVVPTDQGPYVDVWRRLAKAGMLPDDHPAAPTSPPSPREKLPLGVYVNCTVAGSAHAGEGTLVFSPEAAFTESFHADTDDGPSRAGLLSNYLPDPPSSGEWEFSVVTEDGRETRTITLGRLPRPQSGSGLRSRFRASLDEHGRLRVHMAELPYWPAHDLLQVQNERGRVLRQRMTVQDKDRDEFDDPFAGLQ
ncbi:hypothetical protein [Streptomyces sp. NPDC001530]|uniref:hypothetical protein n=1 Tax=Streptomyces sp. NPDC001530 TaxID=3364582 RepID=UPI00368D8BD7